MKLTTEQLEDIINTKEGAVGTQYVAPAIRELLALRAAMKVAEEGLKKIGTSNRYTPSTWPDVALAGAAQAKISELLKGWRE